MKTAFGLLVLLFAASLAGASNIMQTLCPSGTSCEVLVPSNDSSTSNWTVTGAATHREAIDDAAPSSGTCLTAGDGDATELVGPRASACVDVFDLTDCVSCTGKTIDYITFVSVGRVAIACSMNPAILTVKWVIGGIDYTAGTASWSNTSWSTTWSAGIAYTNPATGLAWTASDVNALQLKASKAAQGGSIACDALMTALQVVVVYEPTIPLDDSRIRSAGGD